MNKNLKEIYETFYKQAFRFAFSYVHDEMVAEDIVSEAFVYLWEFGKEKAVDNEKAILITFIKSRSINYLKRLQVKQRAFKELTEKGQRELEIRISTLAECNPQEILSKEFQEKMESLLAEIPERTREACVMNKIEGRTYQEIADYMGVSSKSIEYHISRAIHYLRKNMREYLTLLL